MKFVIHLVAALLMLISAVFHLAIPVLSSFAEGSLVYIALFLAYSILAWFIFNKKRWAVWLGFFVMTFLGIAAMGAYLENNATSLINLGIWIVDWLAAALLFILLWGDKVPEAVETGKTSETVKIPTT